MMKLRKLPVGIESFEKLRREDFYYVDKTGLIRDLLSSWGKVNLFTRPRRFGKTLSMSMLKCFFEIGTDKALFEGLAIAQDQPLCDEYMGKYPVVFVSLKNIEAPSFGEAKQKLVGLIRDEAVRLQFLSDSTEISEPDKKSFGRLLHEEYNNVVLQNSLLLLTKLLSLHYHQKVILLIDEYDVPLDKAFQHGYYQEMVALIRGLFGQALKTNEHLHFAVLTGCLRISKESIFTGLNNFKTLSITDTRFEEHFGFTEAEVREMLDAYGLSAHDSETKEWYDGYRFGNVDVYCPWDVINRVDALRSNEQALPEAYWINTSGNELVKRFINKADRTTQGELEQLVGGAAIEKAVRLELTYPEIDQSIDNLWSVLFTTGYLTQCGRTIDGKYQLVIPNREVREVFVLQIQEWFKHAVNQDAVSMSTLHSAFTSGNAEEIRKQLTVILSKMISVLDTKAKDAQKENFYHGILLGLLRSNPNWNVMSNAESGDGFCDITVEPDDPDMGIVIEVKYAASVAGLPAACDNAMRQIIDRRYDALLRNEGRVNILAFGIAFHKKRCEVVFHKMPHTLA
ncbi:MAG: AAA family ATPase [Clostridia bacterium]